MGSIEGTSLIAGMPAAGAEHSFHAVDPGSGERLDPPFGEATASDVDRAVTEAERVAPEIAAASPEQRAELLDRIAGELEHDADAIVGRADRETGLGLNRLQGELARTTGQLRMFARLVAEGSWVDARIDVGKPNQGGSPKPDVRSMLTPLGPVVVFGASNFPLAFSVAGGDTASALAAGCPVVVKAHQAHPGTSEIAARAVGRAVDGAGMPSGTFSLLQGAGHEVGTALVEHAGTRAVGFTGSFRGGRALYEVAQRRDRPIPFFAEMGSTNPLFVLPDAASARGEEIAEGLHASFTLGHGQFCTKPGLAFVRSDEASEQLVARVAELARATSIRPMLYAGVCEAYLSGRDEVAALEGVEPLVLTPEANRDAPTSAAVAVFRVSATAFRRHERLARELFGPTLIVVTCDSDEEMLDLARGLEGQLTATVHGTEGELEQRHELLRALQRVAGRVIVNGFPTGVAVGPAMQHGGPFPATTDARFTSVGTGAIRRFARPVAYQGFPAALLPEELRDANPRGIWRTVDGERTRAAIER